MLNKKLLTVLGTTVALTVLTPWLDQSQASGQGLQETNTVQERITGTWRIFVNPQPSPAGDPPSFYTYTTFNSEGTLVQSSSGSLDGSRSGHGVWRKTGKDKLKAVFEKFVEFNPLTQQPGIFVFRVEEVITLTGANSYEGSAQVSICNNAGQECQPLRPARTQGSRLRFRLNQK